MNNKLITPNQFFNHWARTNLDPDGNYVHTYISGGSDGTYQNWVKSKQIETKSFVQSDFNTNQPNNKLSSNQDSTKNKLANNIRNVVHNLDLNNKKDMQTYENERLRWFEEMEERKCTSYWDSNNVNTRRRTVGIGFNMDANGKDDWNQAFPNNNTRPNFDDIYSGKAKLTDIEINQLFDHSIKTREFRLKKQFGNDWEKLKPNERLAMEDKYFQSGSVNTLKNDLKNYVNSDNEAYLVNAVSTLSDNQRSVNGIQNRRNYGATLLNSAKSPFYSKPSEPSLPQRYKNKHFRWIHSMPITKNSNPLHVPLNDKIFSIDSKEWEYMTSNRLKGCRCAYEIID